MPKRNTIRHYTEDGIYHVYNRGVDKRNLFESDNDYKHYLGLLESYLNPQESILIRNNQNVAAWRSFLEPGEVTLLCFCLMPNHFHLLLKQRSRDGISKFMRRVSNAYVRYFNSLNDRVGSLYEGKFKAVLVKNDAYLLHLSRYIHRNPLSLGIAPQHLDDYSFSSYGDYLKQHWREWVDIEPITEYFSNTDEDYQTFVENTDHFSDEMVVDISLE